MSKRIVYRYLHRKTLIKPNICINIDKFIIS